MEQEIGECFSAAMLSPREIRLIELFRTMIPFARDTLMEQAESYAKFQNAPPDNLIKFPR